MTTPDADIELLVGAYVCDAVEPDERFAMERHLRGCPKCRAEVADLRNVTALLANSTTPAPDAVWNRILSSLEEAPPPMRLSVAPLEPPAPATMNVVPLPRPLVRRRLVGFAAAAAVVVGVLGFSLGRGTSGSGPRPGGLQAAAYEALVEPGSRTASLLDDGHVKQAVAVVRANGEGYLIGDNLPALTDHIYQLWGATADGAVVSLGVINKPGVIAFNVGDPAAVNTLMLTEEIRPVDHSSNPAVVKGLLA